MSSIKLLWTCLCCLLTIQLCTTQNYSEEYPVESEYEDSSYSLNTEGPATAQRQPQLNDNLNHNHGFLPNRHPRYIPNPKAEESLHNFTFDLFSETQRQNPTGNMVLSPLSVYTGLAMLRPGLRGQSRRQVNKALGARNLQNVEIGKMLSAIYSENEQYDLEQANRVYVDRTIKLNQIYKKKLSKLKIGTNKTDKLIRKVRFSRTPNKARRRINAFVAKNTKKIIRNLLPASSVTPQTRAMIINALYLKANWTSRFRTQDTQMKPFYLIDNQSIMTSTMHQPSMPCTTRRDETYNADITVLALEGNLSVMLLMPTQPGDFTRLFNDDQTSSKTKFKRIFNDIWPTTDRHDRAERFCDVELPRFKVDFETDLTSSLQAMKVRDIFSRTDADLTGMMHQSKSNENQQKLFVSEVRHKAVLTANEEGVKAAAASAIRIDLRRPPSVTTVRVNKPFLFVVRQERTGAVLFAGRVNRPQST